MTKPNLPLLRKILEHIDAHPEEWDQSFWASRSSCGTALCIAGHAVVMTGHEIEWNEFGDVSRRCDGSREIEKVAIEELGLSANQADSLFRAGNTRDDVQYFAERIAKSAGEVL